MKEDYLVPEISRLAALIGRQLANSLQKDKIELKWDEAKTIQQVLLLCHHVLTSIYLGEGIKEIRHAYKLVNKMRKDK